MKKRNEEILRGENVMDPECGRGRKRKSKYDYSDPDSPLFDPDDYDYQQMQAFRRPSHLHKKTNPDY